jgi:hypothetical protein
MSLIDKLKKKVISYDEVSPDLFLDAISKYDNIPQLLRTPIGPNSYIHSSSLENFCARRAAILDKENRVPREYVQGSMKVVWAIGRAVEKHVRDALINSLGKSNFHGKWHCKCGKTTHVGTYADITCKVCNTKASNYDELTIYSEEHKIAANPDLIFLTPSKQQTVIEIKSMNKEEYDKLEEPKSMHVRQASRYVSLKRMDGQTVSPNVIIIYVRKDFLFKNIYKIYSVNVDDPNLILAFKEELDQATKLRKYHETKELPERELCSSMFSTMAKKCPSCNACFA